MCDPITIAAIAAYATGSKLNYDAAKQARNEEAAAFRMLGQNVDRRQSRVEDLDKEIGGIVNSLSQLYGREQGFDQRMADEAQLTEDMASQLVANAPSSMPVAAGESDNLGDQLVQDARVVADETRNRQVEQQIAASANMRSLSDALAQIAPEMVTGVAEINQRQNEQRGQSALSGYDERLYQQQAINARQKAIDPLGQALQMAGQLMGMYSMMAPGTAAAGGGTGLTPGATTGLKASGSVGLKPPPSFGYVPQGSYPLMPY